MRRLVVILLASLAALGGVASATLAIRAAGEGDELSLSVTPARQSVVRGGAVSFDVGLTRASSRNVTSLRVTRLPRGVRATWRLADGTPVGRVPPTETGAIMTLKTSSRTRTGTHHLSVLATAGGSTRVRRVSLTVRRSGSGHFSVRITPARRIVGAGSSARYRVRVVRARGFRGGVRLRLVKVPRGTNPSWGLDDLTIATGASQSPGSHRLVIEGTSRIGGRLVRRYATTVLTVVETHPFPISGHITTPLYPGGRAPLDLVLTNPHSFDIRVGALSVTVLPGTTAADCRGDANFSVTQFSGEPALTLRPGSTRLSALVPDSSMWPQVAMHNLPTNQDACKGAVLSLEYRGGAIR